MNLESKPPLLGSNTDIWAKTNYYIKSSSFAEINLCINNGFYETFYLNEPKTVHFGGKDFIIELRDIYEDSGGYSIDVIKSLF